MREKIVAQIQIPPPRETDTWWVLTQLRSEMVHREIPEGTFHNNNEKQWMSTSLSVDSHEKCFQMTEWQLRGEGLSALAFGKEIFFDLGPRPLSRSSQQLPRVTNLLPSEGIACHEVTRPRQKETGAHPRRLPEGGEAHEGNWVPDLWTTGRMMLASTQYAAGKSGFLLNGN